MNTETLFHYVDHTALKPYVDWEEIKTLCREALEFQMASVCIPSCYIKRVHEMFPKLNICTVVGFPLGYSQTEGKIAETIQAIEDGAMEIDMVVNICDIKNGDWKKVEEEIAALKKAAGDLYFKSNYRDLLSCQRRKDCSMQGCYRCRSGLYQDLHRIWHGRSFFRRCEADEIVYRKACTDKSGRRNQKQRRNGSLYCRRMQQNRYKLRNCHITAGSYKKKPTGD